MARKTAAAKEPAATVEKVRGKKAFAKRLGVTERTITDWQQPSVGGDFRLPGGYYDLAAARRWVEANHRKGAKPDVAGGKEKPTLADLKAAKLAVQIKQETITLREMEREEKIALREILSRSELERTIAEILTVVRDEVTGLPDKLARHVPQKHQARIRREGQKVTDRALAEMALALEKAARGEDLDGGEGEEEGPSR